MNTKTTITLAVFFAACLLGLYVVRSQPAPEPSDTTSRRPMGQAVTSRDLIEDKLGDVVKVEVRRDEDEWVFEKREPDGGGAKEWHIVSPYEAKVVSWEVDRFGRQLGSLRYEISYRPGEAGSVSAADAGLDPPRAVVTLTDADGKRATVEIGKPATEQNTYVRLAGTDTICVGQASLRNLFKSKAVEYRDKQPWRFQKANVKRIEITDRSTPDTPVEYVFVADGDRWLMESPISARATDKVGEAAGELGRLRFTAWVDDDPNKFAVYGVDGTSGWTVRVTTEEVIEIEEPEGDIQDAANDIGKKDEEQPEGSKTETRRTVHTLYIADRSPIGEDTKVYVRAGDENAIGTILKTTAEKLRPVMKEWRDMAITPADVTSATRIELSVRTDRAVLAKRDGQWEFEADESPADADAVDELLEATAGMNAVNFVDADKVGAGGGFDQPQAQIRLTIPGLEEIERIVIGGHTDAASKRLVYVRRNEALSIAKVRTSDVSLITRTPLAYRDRTVFDLPASRVEHITIDRENAYDHQTVRYSLDRTGSEWMLSSPTHATPPQSRVQKLAEALADLRAEAVVGTQSELTAFGLHSPSITVSLTYQPPAEYRVPEPGDAAADGQSESSSEPVRIEADPQVWSLALAVADGKHYAKRADTPAIYEVGKSLFDQLSQEFLPKRVLDFEEKDVTRFSVTSGGPVHVFARRDNEWTYVAEPDLPLDTAKVDKLLLRLRDLDASRYVAFDASNLGEFGLADAAHRVEIQRKNGDPLALIVSNQTGSAGPSRGHFAMIEGTSNVFLLPPDSVGRLRVNLADLE